MNVRPAVPRNTERKLWAEAIGHCMNPACQIELIQNGINVGEMAHIERHADGGNLSFDNLILLCQRCHTLTERSTAENTSSRLREWKNYRNDEIEEQFAKSYGSFNDLKKPVTPLLQRNGQIFGNYGPTNDEPNSPERHKLWLQFESEIVSNNRQLELILTANQNLLPRENQDIVDEFVAHAREFMATRKNNPRLRACLFPEKLLSVFGLAEALIGVPPNLSALQNFVSYLIRTHRFISLELDQEPCLTYLDNGEVVMLMLEDRPRVQQIFWNGHFFQPHSTDVRIGSLIFFARWLGKNNIRYEFTDMTNLTELILNGKHKIKLCYQYVLSISDVHMMTLKEGDIVVNLHNWNGAPTSKDAHEYASAVRARLFSQNDFFKFAHRDIK